MIYLFGYQDIKRISEERRSRSLARYELRRELPSDSFVRLERATDADIVELVFGTHCDAESIGA